MRLPFHDRKFLILLMAVILVIGLEILSLTGIHIAAPYEPFVFLAFILGIGYPVIRSGVKALVKLNFSSISLLMVIAVAGAYYLGEYPEAAVVIVLYVLGERLEEIGIVNSKSALEKLVSDSPKTAVIKETGKEELIDKIRPGTIIRIKPHSMIPLDGVITFGESAVDEATITGEAIPRDKALGDPVFAGTMNKGGFIEVRTTKHAADTTFSKILQLTFKAQAVKSEAQKFIQRFARVYTPSVVVLAVLLLFIPVIFQQRDFNDSLRQAITLLVIACPCALVISTPVAIYAAIGNASSKGILIKGGLYLEAMAGINTVCLDKTRTLTYGKPVVSDVIPLQHTDREELLACAAGAEIFSEHPLAQAIVNRAKQEGYTIHATEKFQSISGKGATAKCLVCEDETILVGKLDYIHEHEPRSQEAEDIVDRLAQTGKTSVVVSFGSGVAGVIGLVDEIKPESAQVIRALHKLKVEPVMLTGDTVVSAKYVADQIGIKKVHGALLPEDKSFLIDQALKEGRSVAMIGDGVNDAPALASASVGIAMGAAGSDVAIETANIALMNDKLSLIPFLILLGRKTVRTIRMNTILAILVKVVFVLLAILGFSHLAMAIIADVGITLVVIWISLRLMNYMPEGSPG
jgi:Cd2+/Zn2+-exporting ATPase